MRIPWWIFLLPLASLAGCRAAADAARPSKGSAAVSGDWLEEAAHSAGLDFVHANGISGRFYFHEMMGPGVALLDYDNDADLDVLVVQGQGGAKLYRNDLAIGVDGSRTLKFTDVTARSGIKT